MVKKGVEPNPEKFISLLRSLKPVCEIRDNLVWETADGQRNKPQNMDQVHVFNTLKMLYNHGALAFGYDVLNPVKLYNNWGVLSQKNPERLAQMIAVFLIEVYDRPGLVRAAQANLEFIIRNLSLSSYMGSLCQKTPEIIRQTNLDAINRINQMLDNAMLGKKTSKEVVELETNQYWEDLGVQ